MTLLKTNQLKTGRCYRGVEGYPNECGMVIRVTREILSAEDRGGLMEGSYMTIEVLVGYRCNQNRTIWFEVERDRWVEISEEEATIYRLANMEP